MNTLISLAKGAEAIRMLGMRSSATPFRKEIERCLDSGNTVSIDFEGKDATQSFVDELVGALVLQRGRVVLSKVSFKNCSDDLKLIIKFVVNDRVQQLNDERAIA
ncbi:STAS-like domain-containing protein [Pseudomonas putida]|uniref:STAS-like domain-containing protein n=1 Tax=Pseudomonas putida TaxID=303 RepID=UPI0018D69416|nr:STAS-like domain-containing protein [Pseudomonas putida]MBH3349836.1 STAS-like domain-containing protein [Pseudomonas putida]